MFAAISINTLNTSVVMLAILAFVISAPYAAYRRRHRRIDLPNTPILLSYYSGGSLMLVPVKKGTIGKLKYTGVLIMKNKDGIAFGGNALLYRVELPFMTKVHLLGIPRQAGATQLNPARRASIMEKVSLEGNYDKYFSLYAEKGMQSDARYVLDPKAMVFTIDFCSSHNWELIGNELYFVQAIGTGAEEDETHMFDDITPFVEQIKPAVAIPSDDIDIDDAVITMRLSPSTYKCPICEQQLKNIQNNYYSCPNNHGILVIGYKLPLVRSGAISNPPNLAETNAKRNSIPCPACSNPMKQVAYNGSKTIIDTCSKCPYRWLDSGELNNVQKPSK